MLTLITTLPALTLMSHFAARGRLERLHISFQAMEIIYWRCLDKLYIIRLIYRTFLFYFYIYCFFLVSWSLWGFLGAIDKCEVRLGFFYFWTRLPLWDLLYLNIIFECVYAVTTVYFCGVSEANNEPLIAVLLTFKYFPCLTVLRSIDHFVLHFPLRECRFSWQKLTYISRSSLTPAHSIQSLYVFHLLFHL